MLKDSLLVITSFICIYGFLILVLSLGQESKSLHKKKINMNKKEEIAFVIMQNTLLDVLGYCNQELNLPEKLIIERVQRALIVSSVIIKPSTGGT